MLQSHQHHKHSREVRFCESGESSVCLFQHVSVNIAMTLANAVFKLFFLLKDYYVLFLDVELGVLT